MTQYFYEKIFRNTVSLFSGRLLSRILQFFLLIYLARAVGVEKYGIFSYAFTLVVMFGLCMDLGISRYMVQQLSRDHSKIRQFLGASLLVKTILCICALVLIMTTSALMGRERETLVVAIMLGAYVAVDNLAKPFFSVFEAVERMGREALVISITNTMMCLAGFIALYYAPGLYVICLIFLLGGIARLVFAGWWCIGLYGWPKWTTDVRRCLRLLRKGVPFALVALSVTVYYHIDTIILASYWGDDIVGYYNAAYRLLEGPLFLVTVFTTAIFPAISRVYSNNKKLLSDFLSKGLEKSIIFGLSVTLFVLHFSDIIITSVYGNDYRQAGDALAIIIISFVFIIPNSIMGTTLRAVDKQNISSCIACFGAILNIILNLIFIPRYSYIAAAWTTVATEIVIALILFKITSSYISTILHMRYAFKLLIIFSCVLIFFQLSANIAILFQVIGFFAIYISLLLFLKIIRIHEVRSLIGYFSLRTTGS